MWGVFEFAVLGGCGRVITLIKNIYICFLDFSLCNFMDLIYAQSACNTPKRKQNLTPLRYFIALHLTN